MKGILFTEPMFRAVIAGSKTQTRRIVNPQLEPEYIRASMGMRLDGSKIIDGMFQKEGESLVITRKPKYQPGEIVYLKEPYLINNSQEVCYKYIDFHFSGSERWPWKNKLFMPAKYARHFISIKDVRVERITQISKEDTIAEGFEDRVQFFAAFKKINKISSDDGYPWVFAYTFELTEKPVV